MNTGKTCKNLTDGLLVAMAIVAVLSILFNVLAFKEEYKMKHPTNNEEVVVSTPWDNPYVDAYVRLAVTFAVAAIIGFCSRKNGWGGIIASICAIIISVNYYADHIIKKNGYLYIGIAVASLAGNLVYMYYYYTEVKKPKGN